MAHFAKLNAQNIVVHVITAGNEYEDSGEELYASILGGKWKRTSYNTIAGNHRLGGTPFRKNYAGIGYSYDENLDAFIPPKPYQSWILNKDTCTWDPPIEYPIDGNDYYWDETQLNWVQVPE